MRVRVLFFASLKDETGEDELMLEVPDGCSLDELYAALGGRVPERAMTALRAENVRLAVNQRLVTPPLGLAPDDEVAFLPPVTGG